MKSLFVICLGLCACSERSMAPTAPPVQTIAGFVLSETERGVTQWINTLRPEFLMSFTPFQISASRGCAA